MPEASEPRARNPAIALALAAALAISGCGGATDAGSAGPAAAFVGGAAADEPRAALVARDILAAGGSAADAAAAAYFALGVTLPSRASLGGGGACLVFDPRLIRVEAVDFVAPPGTGIPVPMNARGFFTLHGRYGRLRWEQVVAPAEAMARFGVPVSRALARDLASHGAGIEARPDLARLFRPRGALLAEGEQLVQPALADMLGTLRARGAREALEGSDGTAFVATARAAGASFTPADLAAAVPQFRAPVSVVHGDLRVAFAPPSTAGGVLQAQMFQLLAPRWSTPADRTALLLDAQLRALGDSRAWNAAGLGDFATLAQAVSPGRMAVLRMAELPAPGAWGAAEAPGATTLVTADREGGVVACAVAAGGAFGSGRVAQGVILAAPTPAAGGGPTLGVMVAVRSLRGAALAARAESGQVVFAGGAGGGVGASAGLMATAFEAMAGRMDGPSGIGAPRAAPASDGSGLVAEPGAMSASATGELTSWAIRSGDALGQVNAIGCPGGLAAASSTCRLRTDPRGHGLAVGGVR